ncbi:MAG: ABC transporter substrate-binding protein, partial [Cereibacter sp.]
MTMMTRLATATGLVLLGLSVPALAEGFGECKVTGTAGSIQIPTVTEGTLTVAAILPAPDSFKGNSPETITGGFEYCLAAEIAHRAGLKSVTVQNVPWPALIAGQLSGFDTAMTNIFITEERLQNVDFTAPYFVATSGVMVRSEDAATITRDNLGEKRLGVFLASVQDRFLDQTLKPTGEVRRFEATADMFTALSAGQIDAV